MNYHLKLNPECKVCRGKGEFSQTHEIGFTEILLCDCVAEQLPEDFDYNKDTYDFEEEVTLKQVKYATLSDLLSGWTIDPKDLDEILFSIKRNFPMLVMDKEDLEDLLILLSKVNIIVIEKVEN